MNFLLVSGNVGLSLHCASLRQPSHWKRTRICLPDNLSDLKYLSSSFYPKHLTLLANGYTLSMLWPTWDTTVAWRSHQHESAFCLVCTIVSNLIQPESPPMFPFYQTGFGTLTLSSKVHDQSKSVDDAPARMIWSAVLPKPKPVLSHCSWLPPSLNSYWHIPLNAVYYRTTAQEPLPTCVC